VRLSFSVICETNFTEETRFDKGATPIASALGGALHRRRSMSANKASGIAFARLFVIFVGVVLVPGASAADQFKTLHKFSGGRNGGGPVADLVADSAGTLYGTTSSGGISSFCPKGCGTVFELSPEPDGSWKETVLYRFQGPPDGAGPDGGVIFDQAGHLYGTTFQGGSGNGGAVFELTPNAKGGWSETIIYSFHGQYDGYLPQSGLVFDSAGNLYGTTISGGTDLDGTVFQLKPNSNGVWTESILHNFCSSRNCLDGLGPAGALVIDGSGNLYGMTSGGGKFKGCTSGCGVVFQLAPNSGGAWTENVLYNFRGKNDGGTPGAGLSWDGLGNLYGTTQAAGANGLGVVFKMTPQGDGSWKEQSLHSFRGRDGQQPLAPVVSDTSGNLYGTTFLGGDLGVCGGFGCGVVFELTPNSKGGWHETVLHRFHDKPGIEPWAAVTLDGSGNLYGTTRGDFNETSSGSVFEITPQ
jgi:uncharacterized repeat protein (TIGR03803 family)